MSIFFKFRSAVNCDSISIEGNGINASSLKEKILEHKNLRKGADFDLVITNAESGEEYTEDSFVRTNTTVIIKRVPTALQKAAIIEHDALEFNANILQLPQKEYNSRNVAFPSAIDQLYDVDDFGVDYYAIDESALTNVEAEETSNVSCLKPRSIQDSFSDSQDVRSILNGHSSGRTVPPLGYVCYRCHQPGHFIQHCPTNGDPDDDVNRVLHSKTDMEDPNDSVRTVTQSSFSKEADPVPSELRCSLCQGIFKEAVLIPCCQYSFCDTCILESLSKNGMCPQCFSTKSTSVDLLPNVALRQAIERFAISKQEQRQREYMDPVMEPSKVHPQSSTLQKTTGYASDKIVVEIEPELPTVDDSVCESAIGSKEKDSIDDGVVGADLAEASFTGRTKKKQHLHSTSASESVMEPVAAGKSRKVNRFCYICGSPEHLARYCTANMADNANIVYPPQRRMLRSVYPRAMAPYSQEMYWPSQPIVHLTIPMAYGDGMYGSCAAMPYSAPALPVGSYGISSFTSAVYPNPPMHGFFGGIVPGMMIPRERPLSREEFMELQDRERRWKLTQEEQDRSDVDRELPQQDSKPASDDDESFSSDSDHSLMKHRPTTGDRYQGTTLRYDYDKSYWRDTLSSKNKQKLSKRHVAESSDEGDYKYHLGESGDNPKFEDSSDHYKTHSQKRTQKTKYSHKSTKMSEKCKDVQNVKGRSASKFSEEHDVASDNCIHGDREGHKSKRTSASIVSDVHREEVKKYEHHVDEDSFERKRSHNEKNLGQTKLSSDHISSDVKKRRKDKRHRSEGSEDRMDASDHDKRKSLRHDSKSRCRKSENVLSEDMVEDRWQMEDGLESFRCTERSKHKHHHRDHHSHSHYHHPHRGSKSAQTVITED